DRAALGGDPGRELAGRVQQLLRLQQVDDVDAVSLTPDVALHAGVPATGLVAEVKSGLQQFPYPRLWHRAPLSRLACSSQAGRGPGSGRWTRLPGRAPTAQRGVGCDCVADSRDRTAASA